MDNLFAYNNKFTKLPEDLQSEVIDFIDFLLTKTKKKIKHVPEPKKSEKKISKIVLGSLEGKITLPNDFNEPLEDLKDYM